MCSHPGHCLWTGPLPPVLGNRTLPAPLVTLQLCRLTANRQAPRAWQLSCLVTLQAPTARHSSARQGPQGWEGAGSSSSLPSRPPSHAAWLGPATAPAPAARLPSTQPGSSTLGRTCGTLEWSSCCCGAPSGGRSPHCCRWRSASLLSCVLQGMFPSCGCLHGILAWLQLPNDCTAPVSCPLESDHQSADVVAGLCSMY